jgi:glutamate synthase domain-containing protein 3
MATLTGQSPAPAAGRTIDCRELTTREINTALRALGGGDEVVLVGADGRHSLAVGLTAACRVTVDGDAGYYAGALGGGALVHVTGHAGNGVAENLDGGEVVVDGDVGSGLAASAHDGLVVVRGSAGSRAGIAMKGGTVVVGGDVGTYSAFMMQLGTLIVLGDAGDHLGDSIYEGTVYVAGRIASLGADAQAAPATPDQTREVAELIARLGMSVPDLELTRVTTKGELYEFDAKTWRHSA